MTPAESEYLIRMMERQAVILQEMSRILGVIVSHYDEWHRAGLVVRVLSTMKDALGNDLTYDIENGGHF